MDEQDLLNLKQKVDRAKTEVAKLRGRKEGLVQDLNDLWRCKDIEAAKKVEQKMKREINELETSIEAKTADIKRKYDV